MPNIDKDNSVVRRTQDYLSRIDRVNPSLCAFTDVLTAQALTEARAAQANPIGALHGLQIAIKDNIDTIGALCSAGLPFLRDRRATNDAKVVAALREAGAIILGVTATDSGAFGVTTPSVTNPALPNRVAGGSSGGSAAAVAARLCDAALGTDTGGSVRIPAACCGVYGFKPTYDAIPMTGVRILTRSFDHVGILARSIATISKITSVLATQLSPPQTAQNPRIAIPWPNLIGTNPEILACLRNLQAKLRAGGFTVSEIVLPSLDEILEVHIGLSLGEAATIYANLAAKDRLALPAAMKTGLAMGEALTESHQSVLNCQRKVILADIDHVFEGVDYLLLPTMPVQPPKIGANTVTMGPNSVDTLNALIRFTAPFNQTGHPALAFPWPVAKNSSSFSLQLIGRRHSDHSLLDFGASLLGMAG